MTIGIPRALMYYYYSPLWKKLFENLGHTVVVSEATTKEIMETGVKYTVSEICVPIKILVGHVMKLIDMSVDMCFVPRLVSVHGNEYFCPKFLGLPDLVRHTLPIKNEQLLTFFVNCKGDDKADFSSYRSLCERLSVSPTLLRSALRDAQQYFDKFRNLQRQGHSFIEAEALLAGKKIVPPPAHVLTIGVLGYVYNLYDSYVSLDILDRLRKMGVQTVTFDTLDERELALPADRKKKIYWTFTRKLQRAAEVLLNRPDIDGLIHVTAFCCGPDSVLGKILESESDLHMKPLMVIRVDEHNGESHVQTRVEAFVDMLTRRKERGQPT